jgi:AcrR family transcriptional regulator
LTEVEESKRERIARRQIDKFAERRDQLAAAALRTLAELGYANTSLRDIAQNSEFSHGVLHYYFADKFELITHCVRQYKADCVTRYDAIVTTSAAADELRTEFGAIMAGTMRDDLTMHRLWPPQRRHRRRAGPGRAGPAAPPDACPLATGPEPPRVPRHWTPRKPMPRAEARGIIG